MKIGLFTDPHYCKTENLGGGRKPQEAFDKIKNAMLDFINQEVEIIFCLGDLIDYIEGTEKESVKADLNEVTSIIKGSKIPFYLIPGNHDFLKLTREDFVKNGIKLPPYTLKRQNLTFIALDANYRSSMNHFDTEGVDWMDSNLPENQICFLKDAIRKAEGECVVLIHESLDPTICESHLVKNASQIREAIEKNGKVKMVIQGHFHDGKETLVNGIPYKTVPAMCENGTHQIIEIL